MSTNRRLSRRARAALAWGLLWLLAGQVGVRALLRARPEIADPEFGRKLADLRRALGEAPGRPLVLMLGSSRVATGFRPAALARDTRPSGASPVVYNFAQVGSGPEMALVSLHRLLAEGIRPDWVFLEYWPPTWSFERGLVEYVEQINVGCLRWSEVRLLASYVPRPDRLYRAWAARQIAPLVWDRAPLLRRYAPAWDLAPDKTDRRCRNLDGSGWWDPAAEMSPEEQRGLVERYRRFYEPRLRRLHVEPKPDRALRAILGLCRREKIRATLIVLPEAEGFRRLYPDAALRQVDAYLARIVREHGVQVVDARTWVPERGFIDGHHLLPEGATAFTRRLGTEVLQPMLAAPSPPLRR